MRFGVFLLLILSISGCSYTMDRIDNIGKAPTMQQVDSPTNRPDYRPVHWPEETPDTRQASNSLWQPGSRHFFRDQRARRIGDILKVKVSIKDTAKFDNSTTASRTANEALGVPNLFGIEKSITKKGHMDPAALASLSNKHDTSGTGSIARKEDVQAEIAAIVTQILPSGNLVVNGSQQIRVNYEMREITVAGIVRPEDVDADNSISSDLIAEARISYGGKGQIDNMQQPRIGEQLLDAFSPF